MKAAGLVALLTCVACASTTGSGLALESVMAEMERPASRAALAAAAGAELRCPETQLDQWQSASTRSDPPWYSGLYVVEGCGKRAAFALHCPPPPQAANRQDPMTSDAEPARKPCTFEVISILDRPPAPPPVR